MFTFSIMFADGTMQSLTTNNIFEAQRNARNMGAMELHGFCTVTKKSFKMEF